MRRHAVLAGVCALTVVTGCAATPTSSPPAPSGPATALPAESAPPQASQVRSKAVDAAVDQLLGAYHDYGRPSSSVAAEVRQNEKAEADLYRASASLIPTPSRVPDNQTHHALFALRDARNGLRGLDRCLSDVVAEAGLATRCTSAKQQANARLSNAFTQVFGVARYGTRSRAQLRRLVSVATRDQSDGAHSSSP